MLAERLNYLSAYHTAIILQCSTRSQFRVIGPYISDTMHEDPPEIVVNLLLIRSENDDVRDNHF